MKPLLRLLICIHSLTCGISFKLLVYHGEETVPHQYPWVIAINFLGGQCAGALLKAGNDSDESDLVITAAHCISRCQNATSSHTTASCTWKTAIPDTVKLRAGVHRLSEVETGESRSGSVLEIHPGWNRDPAQCEEGLASDCFSNDLGLIKVDKPFQFSDTIRPIDVAVADEPIESYEDCVLAGWGYYNNGFSEYGYYDPLDLASSDQLRAINVSILPNGDCAKAYGQGESEEQYKDLLCLKLPSQENTGALSCEGDSGGPLWCKNRNGRPTLIGVISGGDSMCGGEKPSLCARLVKFLDWIEVMKKKLSSLG